MAWPVRLGDLESALPGFDLTVSFHCWKPQRHSWASADREIVDMHWLPHFRGVGCNWSEHWSLSVDPIPREQAGALRPVVVSALRQLAQAAMKPRPKSWRYHPHKLVIGWIASEQQVRFRET
jgi:hypothetical protein